MNILSFEEENQEKHSEKEREEDYIKYAYVNI